jgi:hypothetical protein
VIVSEEIDDHGAWLLEVDIDSAQWGRASRLAEFHLCSVAQEADVAVLAN